MTFGRHSVFQDAPKTRDVTQYLDFRCGDATEEAHWVDVSRSFRTRGPIEWMSAEASEHEELANCQV